MTHQAASEHRAFERALVAAIRGTAGSTRSLLVEQLIWHCSAEREDEVSDAQRLVGGAVATPMDAPSSPVVLVQCVSDNENCTMKNTVKIL